MEVVLQGVKWVGQHSNKVRSAIWQSILLAVALKWITFEEAQLAVIGMFLDAVLGLFVETNTVSKVRVGERIVEGRAKEAAEAEAYRTGGTADTGSGYSKRIPVVLLAVLLSGSMLAGCAKGAHVAALGEDVVHDGLTAFDRSLDANCDAGVLSAPTCKELNQLLVPVWDIKNNLNRTIRGGDEGKVTPIRLADLQNAIKALTAKVVELVQGGAKDMLLRELNLALSQVR